MSSGWRELSGLHRVYHTRFLPLLKAFRMLQPISCRNSAETDIRDMRKTLRKAKSDGWKLENTWNKPEFMWWEQTDEKSLNFALL